MGRPSGYNERMDYMPNATTKPRLLAKTERSKNGCLVFTGAIGGNGYGKIWDGRRASSAHRVAYAIFKGPIPDGYAVCHTCDNKPCVEPSHLFAAPQMANVADMRAKGRDSRGPSHSEAIREGWTPDLRARRAEQTREMMRLRREEAAAAAGVPLNWKRCPRCETWKPRTDYYRNAARDDGLKPYCKPCSKAVDAPWAQDYRLRNKDRMNAASRAYYYEHREAILKRQKDSKG